MNTRPSYIIVNGEIVPTNDTPEDIRVRALRMLARQREAEAARLAEREAYEQAVAEREADVARIPKVS